MDKGGLIFSEGADGQLVAMRPAAPKNEDDLQDLIARFPDVLSATEGDLLLIKREQGVPDALDGYERWSLDHLFVSRAGVPVLVEVKRASDTRIRREVIGQLMDYAANGVVYWPAGALEASFVETCRKNNQNPEEQLQAFIGSRDPAEFWSVVQDHLTSGRLRLVIAADVIPPELARVVEFLNDQMKAEVIAVELRYYLAADGRRTLAPRFIGETEKARTAKMVGSGSRLPPMNVDDWLQERFSGKPASVLLGARAHLAIMARLGAELAVPATRGSVRGAFLADDGSRVRPLDLLSEGKIQIGFGNLLQCEQLKDEPVRQRIYDAFTAAVGTLNGTNLVGFPSFPVERLAKPEAAQAYEHVAADLIELAKR